MGEIFLCVHWNSLYKGKTDKVASKSTRCVSVWKDSPLICLTAHKLLWSEAPRHPKQITSWLFLKETRESGQPTEITPVGYIKKLWCANTQDESLAPAASRWWSLLKPTFQILWFFHFRLNLVSLVVILHPHFIHYATGTVHDVCPLVHHFYNYCIYLLYFWGQTLPSFSICLKMLKENVA